jgi:hypothetical protein
LNGVEHLWPKVIASQKIVGEVFRGVASRGGVMVIVEKVKVERGRDNKTGTLIPK